MTALQERQRTLDPVLAQEVIAEAPNILGQRPLGAALNNTRAEALMPRSEAPNPVVLERLATMPIAKWLGYRPDPANRRYGEDQTMEMLHVPASDPEAARIRGRGNVDYTKVITNDEVMSSAQIINNNFAFLSMYAKRAGESFAQTSAHTQGFGWNRRALGIENAGIDILEAVAGTHDVVWVRVGDEKIVGFFRGKRDMHAMAEASVTAAIPAYQEHLPSHAVGQTEIQLNRMSDVLDPEKGSARKWIEVKEGTRDGMKRAWDDKDDSKLSFWFGSEQVVEDGKLRQQGIGIDGKPMTWEYIAANAPELKMGDTSTTDVMRSLDQYFAGEDTEDRFAVMFTWAPDTTCCGEAASSLAAGQENLVTSSLFEMDAIQKITSARISGQSIGTLSYPNGEKYSANDYCDKCNSKRTNEGSCNSCTEKSKAA